MVSVLLRDPTSWTQAAVNDWRNPVSYEWIQGAHLYDLLAAVNSKRKPKPYPTPWPAPGAGRVGGRKMQDRDHVKKLLDRMNPKDGK